MMNKVLFLMVGIQGSGKSTIATTIANMLGNSIYVSRDRIRFSLLDGTQNYFNNEKQVFDEYVHWINTAIENDEIKYVFADATHINQKSRNKILNKLNLSDVDIIPIFVNTPIETCLERNELREGLSRVPDSAIKDMNSRLEPPTYNEKYKYKYILELKI